MSRFSYGEQPTAAGDFVMPFGKFKGQRLRDIGDRKILEYYLTWKDLPHAYRKAIQRWLTIPTLRTESSNEA